MVCRFLAIEFRGFFFFHFTCDLRMYFLCFVHSELLNKMLVVFSTVFVSFLCDLVFHYENTPIQIY